jgi:hypothetical protein
MALPFGERHYPSRIMSGSANLTPPQPVHGQAEKDLPVSLGFWQFSCLNIHWQAGQEES